MYGVFAYGVGCLCFGYYLTHYYTGRNLAEIGSRSLGATNVSRIMGKKGFIVTAGLDLLKGYLVILFARHLGFSEIFLFVFSIAVVVGHIWPVQLDFKGGKGVAPFGGTMLAISAFVLIPVIVSFLFFYLLIRKFSMAGLLCGTTIPFYLYYMDFSFSCILLNFLLILIIFIAHRQNIRQFISKLRNG